MKSNIVLNTFERLRHRLHSAARNIAGEDSADDVLQDAFCKLWTLKKLPDSQEQATRVASAIVRNTSIDYLRNAKMQTERKMPDYETTNSKEQEVRDVFDEVKLIIEQQLNETQRQVLWKRDYEGYSFAEVAEQMGMTEDNARQVLSRARKIVRETYKRLS